MLLSRLDYCNVLYVESCQTNISPLQLVQNAAARLLVGAKSSYLSYFSFSQKVTSELQDKI